MDFQSIRITDTITNEGFEFKTLGMKSEDITNIPKNFYNIKKLNVFTESDTLNEFLN